MKSKISLIVVVFSQIIFGCGNYGQTEDNPPVSCIKSNVFDKLDQHQMVLKPSKKNPIISIYDFDNSSLSNNIYAPDYHELEDGKKIIFFGAQGKDGHDQIYLASYENDQWIMYPNNTNPIPVLSRGSSNHVNDPSVIYKDGFWYMYYTDALSGEEDRIWVAIATQITKFEKVSQILGPSQAGGWDSYKVGRPSALIDKESDTIQLFYDGATKNDNSDRNVGFVKSRDPLNFTRHSSSPVLFNAGAVDVKKIGQYYVLVTESIFGTYGAISVDPENWGVCDCVIELSGESYDRYGQVTPALMINSEKELIGILFGGASNASWTGNAIMEYYKEQ
jgi:hypothetical protein